MVGARRSRRLVKRDQGNQGPVRVSNVVPGRVRPLAPARVVVDVVAPLVDAGRYPAKGTVGEPVVVTADVFLDGHDHPAAALWYAPPLPGKSVIRVLPPEASLMV